MTLPALALRMTLINRRVTFSTIPAPCSAPRASRVTFLSLITAQEHIARVHFNQTFLYVAEWLRTTRTSSISVIREQSSCTSSPKSISGDAATAAAMAAAAAGAGHANTAHSPSTLRSRVLRQVCEHVLLLDFPPPPLRETASRVPGTAYYSSAKVFCYMLGRGIHAANIYYG